MYHEAQKYQLCALHALNNLFQDGSAFSKRDLDGICTQLSPVSLINPHRSILGLGNYDINVIISALHTKSCDMIWFDKRNPVQQLYLSNIFGFILNKPCNTDVGFFTIPFKRKHWIAVRAIDGCYYNLDSKLPSPERIGDDAGLYAFFESELNQDEVELMVVVSKEVHTQESWKREILDYD